MRNHFKSKKFTMAIFSICCVFTLYFISAVLLRSYLPDQAVAFTAMFKDTMMCLSIIVGALLGVQGAVDYKWNSSNVNLESKTNTITQIFETSKKDDDYELN